MRLPHRRRGVCTLLAALALGLLLFVWHLGRSGLVDETPPLFAASARAMAETGDWLVPRVNGLPRYDKPPLVYWLIGALHLLPGRALWDPLGGWAANLPSALAVVAVMLLLADTLLRFPQQGPPQPSLAALPAPVASDGQVSAASAPAASAGEAAEPRRPAGTLRLAAIDPASLTAALAFALSPLVLLWGRIGVSDALFSATLSGALLLAWRRYAAGDREGGGREGLRGWWQPWTVLALAVLTKGPVAVVLVGLILAGFAWCQRDGRTLIRRLRPLAGLALLTALSLPWYALTLWREGQPYWDSFFGYHNLQRFTSVVNHHLQPWWYFGPVLVVASLPATPLLLLGLARALPAPPPLPPPQASATGRTAGGEPLPPSQRLPGWRRWIPPRPAAKPPASSLAAFAACWLLGVLAFFTLAATKLPSYWLPATPAAGLLIALAGLRPDGADPRHPAPGAADPQVRCGPDRALQRAWLATLLLTALLGVVFLAGPLWVPAIQDPELPTLPAGILASGRLWAAAACWLLAAALGWILRRRPWPQPLLLQQLPLVAFVPLALIPLWGLGDQLRGAPVRAMAAAVARQARPGEPLAMVGILKPSLHYYSRRVVLYEGIPPEGPLNLADRLRRERRPGQPPSTPAQQPSVLVVIDNTTAAAPHWQGLAPRELARSGLYRLWRLDRQRLEERAAALRRRGLTPTWDLPRPERY